MKKLKLKKNICFLQMVAIIIATSFLYTCSPKTNSSANYNSIKTPEEKVSDIDKKVLSLCDIGNNASEFDDKIIRLKTRMTFGTENTIISNKNCSYSAVVTFKDDKDEDAYRLIDKMRKDSSRKKVTIFYADVDIEGKFINKPFTECCTKTLFQFEITKTFEAQPVTSN